MYYTEVINNKLSLITREHAKEKPICVDFCNSQMQYRVGNNRVLHESLKKVFNLDTSLGKPSVLDLSAGFGQDSFLLACIGYNITMLERNLVIFKLLEDGLARAKQHPQIAKIVDNMQLLQADAVDYLQNLNKADYPDAIYFDPMFEARTKKSLMKKNMQALQQIIGPDQDASEVLKMALCKAKKKVVVKRHRLAPRLLDNCNYTILGKSVRFDVYTPVPLVL